MLAGENSPAGREALGGLCEAYWVPLYVFARRRGDDVHAAQDLVQGFFTELLEKGNLRQADRERGRFRTFLLAAFKHHASRQREHRDARKRGGGRTILSLDFDRGEEHYRHEPADLETPEKAYERRWALTLLDRALQRLRSRHHGRAAEVLDALQGFLLGGDGETTYREAGQRLGMSETAVKVSVHRLRRRYRDALREEIGLTVADPSSIDDEIRTLMDALG